MQSWMGRSSAWTPRDVANSKSFFIGEGEPCSSRSIWYGFNGVDLRQVPLIERKKKLRKLIERSECSQILYAQHIEGNGKLFFEEVCERNLEGVVAKRRMSVYAEHGWLKIKNPKYTQAEGRHDMFTAFQERRKS